MEIDQARRLDKSACGGVNRRRESVAGQRLTEA
jgi:hypothetical protein